MKTKLMMLCLAGLLAAGAIPVAAQEAPDIEAEHDALRELKALYERAISEDAPEQLRPHIAEGFSGVTLTSLPVDDFDGLLGYWAEIKEMMGEGGRYSVTVKPAVKSLLFGNIAVAHGKSEDLVVTGGGKEYRFEGQWTAVCLKQDGRWKLLRVHGSMDPLGNPFVLSALKGTMLTTGGALLAVGLVLGWLGHLLFARWRRQAA